MQYKSVIICKCIFLFVIDVTSGQRDEEEDKKTKETQSEKKSRKRRYS